MLISDSGTDMIKLPNGDEPKLEDILACLKYLQNQATQMNLVLVAWQIGCTAASVDVLIKTREYLMPLR